MQTLWKKSYSEKVEGRFYFPRGGGFGTLAVWKKRCLSPAEDDKHQNRIYQYIILVYTPLKTGQSWGEGSLFMTLSDTAAVPDPVSIQPPTALLSSNPIAVRAGVTVKASQRIVLFYKDSLEIEACFRLRHTYFVQERGWVSENEETPGLEIDAYDPHALHLSVWKGGEVAAYLRILPYNPEVGFMIDRELSALLSDEEREVLPRENAVEFSRLVCRVDKSSEEGQGSAQGSSQTGDSRVMELLFRQLYQVSLERGFTRFYIVVEAGWLRFFARRFGLAFHPIGKPHRFPDGTRTVAATATLEELEAGMRRHSEEKYGWYRQAGDAEDK